jgi:hypothetical protein
MRFPKNIICLVFLFSLFENKGFNNEFTLLTTLYNEKNLERISEYEYALTKNLMLSCIKKIIIFYENFNEYSFINKLLEEHTDKLEIIPIDSRPSFSSFFDFANKNLKTKKVIIANADIYFDRSLKLLNYKYLANSLISLNRYEDLPDQIKMLDIGLKIGNDFYSFSADTWIFCSPIKVKISEQFLLGTSHCEKFLNDVLKYKLTLKNPALDIKSYHVHNSKIRNYEIKDNYSNYPFIFLKATKVIDKPKMIIKNPKN